MKHHAAFVPLKGVGGWDSVNGVTWRSHLCRRVIGQIRGSHQSIDCICHSRVFTKKKIALTMLSCQNTTLKIYKNTVERFIQKKTFPKIYESNIILSDLRTTEAGLARG